MEKETTRPRRTRRTALPEAYRRMVRNPHQRIPFIVDMARLREAGLA